MLVVFQGHKDAKVREALFCIIQMISNDSDD